MAGGRSRQQTARRYQRRVRPRPGRVAVLGTVPDGSDKALEEGTGVRRRAAGSASSRRTSSEATPRTRTAARTTGSPRGLGLPAVLAAVLALGVASLLVRVLLAEPAARRVTAGPAGPDPVATVD